MENNNRILNVLRIQPLSEDEMTARHILGRLYGPIATCVESTRNGRLYNKDLWEKALRDEIFLEKVATKALFLELGHPTDREETDMKQACACIPEVPKIVGDDLYAYVDILDTPNGRLLKTLVDYGFVPGISSRGSGDVMDNNQVDPETFFLETWDIVQLPAVKKARLNVCESLGSDGVKLKKALAESYNAAKEEDKDAMKKALKNLNISLEEAFINPQDKLIEEYDDLPWDEDELDVGDDALFEDAEETDEVEETAETPAEGAEPAESEQPATEEAEAEQTDAAAADADADTDGFGTVGDAVTKLQEYEDDIKIEFETVELDGQEYPVENISSSIKDEGDEKVLVVGVDCGDAISDESDDSDDAEAADDIKIETNAKATDDSATGEEAETPAEDTGDADVLESLKEMVRQKEALESELSKLRKTKSVGDAKEKELQEKLSRYRDAFSKASAEAAKVPELLAKINELTEHLKKSRKNIKELTEQVNNARQLKESADVAATAKNKKLSEQVNKLTQRNTALEAQLEEQTKQYQGKLQERTDLAKSYKKRCLETLNRYIESKASMLGVASSEITSRLNENYTLSDVDAVCDTILNSAVNFGRLPFGGRAKASARISESVSKKTTANAFTDPAYGYDIDDSLLELAGLK